MTSFMRIMAELPAGAAVALKLTLLLAAGWLLHFTLAGRNPRWRVLVWRLVMAGLILLPPAEWLLPKLRLTVAAPPPAVASPPPENTLPADFTAPPLVPTASAAPALANENKIAPPRSALGEWVSGHWLPLVCGLWLAVALALGARALYVYMRLRRLILSTGPAPEDLRILTRSLAEALGCRPPELRLTSTLLSPFVAGVVRPVVVLPAALTDDKRERDLPAILAHELAHIRARDLFWMALARWIALALWFHPLAWAVRRAHNAACEEVCDGVAAEHAGGAPAYSRTLAGTFLELVVDAPHPVGVPMLRPAEITRRIQNLRRGIRVQNLKRSRIIGLALITGVLLAGIASLKVARAAEPGTLRFPADRGMGWLSVREAGAKEPSDWKPLGEAKGEVAVPAGKEVKLRIEGAIDDLSPLRRLDPNGLHTVLITRSSLSDDDLQALAGLTGLRSLSLGGLQMESAPFTGSGLAHLKNLAALEDLTILFTRLNDAGLANVTRFPNLKSLTLWNDENLTGAGLAPLKELKALKSLSLYMTPITDEGMRHVKELKGLEYLGVEYAKLTPVGVAAIAELSGLKRLAIYEKIPGSALAPLKSLARLEHLTLAQMEIRDEDLTALAGFSALKHLGLSLDGLSGAGLRHLRALPALNEISVRLSKATDESMKGVEGLNVVALNLDGSEVGDAGLAYLKSMTSLEQLYLRETRITDAGLAHLAGLTALEILRMDRTQVTDQGLAHLKGLTKLGDLWLSGTQVGDASFETIGNFRQLGQLILEKTKVTDAGIKRLDQHPCLIILNLADTQISDQCIQTIKTMPRLESLGVSNTAFTDAGLLQLAEAKRLTQVSLDHTQVTPDGIAKFKALRPACMIYGAAMEQAQDSRSSESLRLDSSPREELGRLKSNPKLKSLKLSKEGERYTAADFAHLARFPNLEQLTIDAGRVTDESLAQLQTLKSLKDLRLCMDLHDTANFFSDAGLANLKEIKSLEKVDIRYNAKFTNQGLACLAELPNLKCLEIPNAFGFTDVGLAHIAKMKHLERLYLRGDQLTDNGLPNLYGHPALKSFELLDFGTISKVTWQGLERLKEHNPNLDFGERFNKQSPSNSSIPVENTQQTFQATRVIHFPDEKYYGTLSVRDPGPVFTFWPADWKHLGEAKGDVQVPVGKELLFMCNVGGNAPLNLSPLAALGPDDLQAISISATSVTDADLAALAGLKGLTRLSITDGLPAFYFGAKSLGEQQAKPKPSQMTREGLSRLKGLAALRELVLHSHITDEDLEPLGALKALEYLSLSSARMTGAGLARLKELPALKLLSLDGPGVTDAALENIPRFRALTTLRLTRTGVTDAGLAHLRGMAGLRDLVLPPAAGDQGLAALKPLDGLERLEFVNTRVTDAGLAQLKNFPRLKSLRIFSNKGVLNGSGLVHLRELPALEEADISIHGLNDANLAHLRGLRSVTRLDLYKSPVSDVGLAALEGMAGLKELYLGETAISDAGLAHVRGLNTLTELRLDKTAVSEAGLKNLADLRALKLLNLNRTLVHDEDLTHLKDLKTLEGLWLEGTAISDAGLAHLQGLQALCWLILDNTQVTDAGLKTLTALPALKLLSLNATPVTEQGIAEFKRVRPDCEVKFFGKVHVNAPESKKTVKFLIEAQYLDTDTTASRADGQRIDLEKALGLQPNLFERAENGEMKPVGGAPRLLDPKALEKIRELVAAGRLRSDAKPQVAVLANETAEYFFGSKIPRKDPQTGEASYADIGDKISVVIASGENGVIQIKKLKLQASTESQMKDTELSIELPPGAAVLLNHPLKAGQYILCGVEKTK